MNRRKGGFSKAADLAVRTLSAIALGLGSLCAAAAQNTPAELIPQPSAVSSPRAERIPAAPDFAPPGSSTISPGVQQLLAFKDSDVKFSLPELMDILRDHRHEGWMLAAYPDPKTTRPLIGAGFSLDLPEREHPQTDPQNPHLFVEPSSAQLWEAAGLKPARLTEILAEYHQHLAAWKTKRARRRFFSLDPEITDQEANLLLRIAAIQAVDNARAYCRSFDQLSASQQMAMSQLVYQMGVNLQEFGQFLSLVNTGSGTTPADTPAAAGERYWNDVQHSLVQSQWARLYRTRAISVIAMLDPQYGDDPSVAEQRIAATLHPAVSRRHRHGRRAALRSATYSRHSGHGGRARRSRLRNKRRV